MPPSKQNKNLVLLVDIDGTLVDTDKLLSEATVDMFKRYGVLFHPDEMFQMKRFLAPDGRGGLEMKTTMLFGAAWEDSYYYLASKNPFPDPGVDIFRKQIIEEVTRGHSHIPVRQDVVNILLELKRNYADTGVTIWAVTNASRKEAVANLALVAKHGLTVDGYICADDVANRKPHPDPYLIGLEEAGKFLGAQGHQTTRALVAMFEDSPPGGKSAAAAAVAISERHPCHVPVCFYIPTTRRPLLQPSLTADETGYFSVQQNMPTVKMEIETLLTGRQVQQRTPTLSKKEAHL